MDEKNTKEINLLQLLTIVFEWVKNFLNKIFGFIGHLMQLIIKYWIVVAAVLFLCVAAGQFLARPSAHKYKAGAVAFLYGSNITTAKEVCHQLQNSVATEKSLSLAYKLGIPDSVAQNIVEIKNFDVIDYLKDGTQDVIDFKHKHVLTDTLNLVMQDRMYIQVETKKISQIPVVQQALLNYFNANPVMQGEFASVKRGLEEKVALCDKEISRLDSLAKVTYFKDADKKISFENNRLIVGDQNKQLFYGDVLNLQSQKVQTENLLVFFKQPMNFTSGLVVDPNPVNNPIKYGVYSFIIAVLASSVLVYVIENLKKIIKYLTNKK